MDKRQTEFLLIFTFSLYGFRKCSTEQVQPNQTRFYRKRKKALIMVVRHIALVEKMCRLTGYEGRIILLLFLSFLSFLGVVSNSTSYSELITLKILPTV